MQAVNWRIAIPVLAVLVASTAAAIPWGAQLKHGPHRLDGSEVACTLNDVVVACRVYDAIDGRMRYETVVVPEGSYVVQAIEFCGATTMPTTQVKRGVWGPDGKLRKHTDD